MPRKPHVKARVAQTWEEIFPEAIGLLRTRLEKKTNETSYNIAKRMADFARRGFPQEVTEEFHTTDTIASAAEALIDECFAGGGTHSYAIISPDVDIEGPVSDVTPFRRPGAPERWTESMDPSTWNLFTNEVGEKVMHPADHVRRAAKLLCSHDKRAQVTPDHLRAMLRDAEVIAGISGAQPMTEGQRYISSLIDRTWSDISTFESELEVVRREYDQANSGERLDYLDSAITWWLDERAARREKKAIARDEKRVARKAHRARSAGKLHYLPEPEFEKHTEEELYKRVRCNEKLDEAISDRFGDAHVVFLPREKHPSKLELLIVSNETDEFGVPEVLFTKTYESSEAVPNEAELLSSDAMCALAFEIKHGADTVEHKEYSREAWSARQQQAEVDGFLFGDFGRKR